MKALIAAIATVWLIGMLVVTLMGQEEIERKQLQNYCDMVDIYKDSEGENGWPDYKNIYDKDCK